MRLRARVVRMTRSLQSRFLLSVGALLVVFTGAISFAVQDRLTRLLLRETRAKGVAIAQSIGAATTSALLNYDYVSLAQAAQKSVTEGGIAYVIILNKEGKVAAHSERADLAGMKVGAPASRDGSPRGPRLRHTVVGSGGGRIRALDVTYPVFLEGSDVQWGTVRIGLDLEPMHDEATRLRLMLIGIGVVGVLFALLGARVISRKITASIEHLVGGTIQVSRGNLDHRIEIATDDEIATLAAHFNHMTEQVKKQQDEIAVAKKELEILNATLEEKVATRTQDFLASEEKYRILVDNSPDPILICQDSAIRFLNPAFESLFGYGLEDALRQGVRAGDLFHPEDRAEALAIVDRVTHGADEEPAELRMVTRDGATRLCEMRAMRIGYLGERAVELILMDTTEKKELQDHLVQHEKLRAMGELASGVAHDFNNILGIILGRAQLLQGRAHDEEVLRGLRTIERAAFDGGETVRRIQDFARSRTEQDFSDVDLETLLEEVVEITRTRWRDQAELRNVRIDVALSLREVGPVKGNGSELREVYTNLIFNAVDAMPSGGTITIEADTEGPEAVVRVRDTGHGMDEDVRARIFDPFFTTKGASGMGLGMSVVYGIIERHGGKITVDSEPRQGTTFTIRLPTCTPEPPSASADDDHGPDVSARVLVIDDEPDILDLMADILDAGGHTAVTAASGRDALERLAAEPFDVIFCDLGMRGMSGWEVVSTVRAGNPAIGLVLLTGWGATLASERVEEYEVDAVLNKPFEMKRILDTVSEIAQRSRARRRDPGHPVT